MKTVLALEWSSRRISATLCCGGGEPVERHIELPRFRAPEAMNLVDSLLMETGLELKAVTELRIGRGPGNYSGVRQAFAWAAGACAPGGICLRAVSSGQAQAFRLLQSENRFWVLGDARRGQWWGAEAGPDMIWELRPPEAWRSKIGERSVFSAEAQRLEGLPGLVQDFPLATDLLRLPDERFSDPTEPLYLHPPVSG